MNESFKKDFWYTMALGAWGAHAGDSVERYGLVKGLGVVLLAFAVCALVNYVLLKIGYAVINRYVL